MHSQLMQVVIWIASICLADTARLRMEGLKRDGEHAAVGMMYMKQGGAHYHQDNSLDYLPGILKGIFGEPGSELGQADAFLHFYAEHNPTDELAPELLKLLPTKDDVDELRASDEAQSVSDDEVLQKLRDPISKHCAEYRKTVGTDQVGDCERLLETLLRRLRNEYDILAIDGPVSSKYWDDDEKDRLGDLVDAKEAKYSAEYQEELQEKLYKLRNKMDNAVRQGKMSEEEGRVWFGQEEDNLLQWFHSKVARKVRKAKTKIQHQIVEDFIKNGSFVAGSGRQNSAVLYYNWRRVDCKKLKYISALPEQMAEKGGEGHFQEWLASEDGQEWTAKHPNKNGLAHYKHKLEARSSIVADCYKEGRPFHIVATDVPIPPAMKLDYKESLNAHLLSKKSKSKRVEKLIGKETCSPSVIFGDLNVRIPADRLMIVDSELGCSGNKSTCPDGININFLANLIYDAYAGEEQSLAQQAMNKLVAILATDTLARRNATIEPLAEHFVFPEPYFLIPQAESSVPTDATIKATPLDDTNAIAELHHLQKIHVANPLTYPTYKYFAPCAIFGPKGPAGSKLSREEALANIRSCLFKKMQTRKDNGEIQFGWLDRVGWTVSGKNSFKLYEPLMNEMTNDHLPFLARVDLDLESW